MAMINTVLAVVLGIGAYLAVWWVTERFGIIWLPVAVIAGAAIASLAG